MPKLDNPILFFDRSKFSSPYTLEIYANHHNGAEKILLRRYFLKP
jgi:hypothetical protein